MASAARPTLTGTSRGAVPCHLSFPLADLAHVKAEAVSLDRRGAVIRLPEANRAAAVKASDTVILDLTLPGHHQYGRRILHFLGRATVVSRQPSGRLWLAIVFTHVSIAPVAQPPSISQWMDIEPGTCT